MRRIQGRVCFFLPFWSEIGYQFRPFWSEIGYGLCTLVLNWVCFLEEATSSFSDKTTYFVHNSGVIVPGVPCGDHGNWD